MLLRDADPAELPHLADAHEERQQHVDDGALDRPLDERGVEHGVRTILVERGDRVEQLGNEHRRVGAQPQRRGARVATLGCRVAATRSAGTGPAPRRCPRGAGHRATVTVLGAHRRARALGLEDAARRLDGADPAVAQEDDLTDAALVLVAVEPVAATCGTRSGRRRP